MGFGWSRLAGALAAGLLFSTAASALDTDGDGMSDAFEAMHGFDPADADENLNDRLDGHDDADGDGLANRYEEALGCDPAVMDSDGDGLNDGDEIGTGVYGPEQTILESAVGQIWDRQARWGDIDSDGDIDLIVFVRDSMELWWYENEAPAPGPWQGHYIGTLTDDVQEVFATDLDNDGDTDLVASADSGFEFTWFRNRGANTLSFANRLIFWVTGFPAGMVVGDFDSDLDQDVIAVTSSFGQDPPNGDLLYFFENDLLDTEPWPDTVLDDSIYWESGPLGVIDANGDGEPNVLIEENGTGIEWFELSDTAPFTYVRHIAAPDVNGASNLIFRGVADLDADGHEDLLIRRWPGPTDFWVENSGGANPSWTEHPIPSTGEGRDLPSAGDFDLDGDLDLLCQIPKDANTEGDHYILENQGTSPPTFTTLDLSEGPEFSPQTVHLIDMDGDLDLDLAIHVHARFYWRAQLNLGDPTLADTDADGLDDGEEQTWSTDPFSPDTDLDGALDGHEVASGTDPLDPASTPSQPAGVATNSTPSILALLTMLITVGIWVLGTRAHSRGSAA